MADTKTKRSQRYSFIYSRLTEFIFNPSSTNVTKNFIGLTVLMLSLGFFKQVLSTQSNWLILLFVIYASILGVGALLLIAEFARKVSISVDSKSATDKIRKRNTGESFSIYLATNGFMGLVAPLFYLNQIELLIVQALKRLPRTDSLLCDLRIDLIQFYTTNNFFQQINQLIFYLALALLLLAVVGPFLERLIHVRSQK